MKVDRLLGLSFKPCTPVFIWADQPIYLPQFEQEITVLTCRLRSASQQRWALCFNDSYRFTIALLAVLAAQKQPIILPNHQAGTLTLFQKEYDAVLSDLPTVTATPIDFPAGESVLTKLTLSSEQTLIFFTSGSTGEPKKIQRSLLAILQELEVLETQFGSQLQDAKVYSSVSHQHIYGLLFYLLWPLTVGRSMIGPILQYPESLLTLFKREENLVFISSPTLLSRLDFKLACKLKPTIFTSGGLLKDSTAQTLWAHLELAPIEILGSTETSGVAFRQQKLQPGWQTLLKVALSQDLKTGCLKVQSPFFDEAEPILMGDQIEMQAQGLFKLTGRADRIVKIEGKRLSLNAIEQKIKKHPLIIEAQVLNLDTHRQLLAVVLILNESGKEALQKQGKRHLDGLLQAWLLPFYEAVLCPKKTRYVDALPVNEQGKVTQLALQQLFLQQQPFLRWPQVLKVSVYDTEQTVHIDLDLPARLIYFQGHFPLHPILPGVAQINFAISYAAQYLGLSKENMMGLSQIKFLKIIRPDIQVTLVLNLTETGLNFRYSTGDIIYSSGKIKFKRNLNS